MKTTDTPTCRCLACGMLINNATGEEEPEVDDISICLNCGNLMVFNWDLTVRTMTRKEMEEIARSDDVLAIQKIRAGWCNGYS